MKTKSKKPAAKIEKAQKDDYRALIRIWEASVRATHDFLEEDDIIALRLLILEKYFDAVDLYCARGESNDIFGFCGVHGDTIEMLFVSPDSVGTGVGSSLLQYAINNLGAARVDVNEQNPKALGFYEHHRFKVTGRSPLDGQDRPYPLLHMELKKG